MPMAAPIPTDDIGCALVKISASGPMPTSRYCDHRPSARSTSLTRAASAEPGRTLRRLSPTTPAIFLRTASACAGSPRACSSMTRSSMLATNVTPAALIACRSQGERSHGREGSRPSSVELRSVSDNEATRGNASACRISRATSGRFRSSLIVAAIPERSSRLSPSMRTMAGPSTSGIQTRPSSNARSASMGRVSGIKFGIGYQGSESKRTSTSCGNAIIRVLVERVTEDSNLIPDTRPLIPDTRFLIPDLYPECMPRASGMLALDSRHTMYWEECGNRNGVPVLFIHGGPGGGSLPHHRRFYDPSCFRIVLYDQSGAGRSTPAAELADNTTAHLVDDIERLRTHLGIERWLLFGGSWGSTLALVYAEAHPARVLGLVLRGVFLATRGEVEW